MPEMIQQNELVTYECPACGYILKDRAGVKLKCPKCHPKFKGWASFKDSGTQLEDE